MTHLEHIMGAKNPREALFLVAQALDDHERRLAALEAQPADEWGTWGDSKSPAGTPAGNPPVASSSPHAQNDVIVIPVDPEEVSRLEFEYAEANNQLELNRRGGDKIRIMELANRVEGLRGRLNLAKNPGSILTRSGDMDGDPEAFFKVSGGLDSLEIELPPSSDKQKQWRRELAEAIDLAGFFPAVMRQTDEAKAEIVENYVKGGPYWLYAGDQEGRKMIMSMSLEARHAMVMDMNEYGDTRVAHEFARDILKSEDGVDSEFSKDYINSVADHGGAPYAGIGEN